MLEKLDPFTASLTVKEALEHGVPVETIEALGDLHERLAAMCRQQFEDGTAELVLALDASYVPSGKEHRVGVEALVSWGWPLKRAEAVVSEVSAHRDGLRVVVTPKSDSDWVDTFCMIDMGQLGAPLMHDAAAWVRRPKLKLVKG